MSRSVRSRRTRAALPLALALAGLMAAPAPALAEPPLERDAGPAVTYALPAAGAFPEGIAVLGDRFYVGATSDGTLYEGDLTTGAVTVYSPGGADGRTTAIGIKATAGRLYVAGGATGTVFVYERSSGRLLATFGNGVTGEGGTFVNDLAVAPDGDVYVTDSFRSVLYRIPADLSGEPLSGTDALRLEPAIDFTGTVFEYVDGFNANGIAITDDGRTAYVVQSATGELFAIRLKDRGRQLVREVAVTDPDSEDYPLTAGDGILLQGDTLRVLRNSEEQLVSLRLHPNGKRAVVTSVVTDETFRFPTTLAAAGDRLLVVNSQFGARRAGRPPALPFTVTSIPAP